MSPSTTDTAAPTEELLQQQLQEAEKLASEAWHKFISAPFALKQSARADFYTAETRRDRLQQQLASANR